MLKMPEYNKIRFRDLIAILPRAHKYMIFYWDSKAAKTLDKSNGPYTVEELKNCKNLFDRQVTEIDKYYIEVSDKKVTDDE